MAAVAALIMQSGIGGAEFGALRRQLIPVAALELLLPAECGGDRLREALLIPRTALDRALHGLAEIIGLLREGESPRDRRRARLPRSARCGR